jgi:hypothetical protein
MKLGNKEYKLAYTMSALDAIEERAGDIERLDVLMQGKGRFGNVVWLVTLGINSWITREKALDPDYDVKRVSEEHVGALLDWKNPTPIVNEILKAFEENATPPSNLADEEEDEDPN